MELASGQVLEQMLQGIGEQRLLEERYLIVSEGINSTVARRVINQLLTLEAMQPGKPIVMVINSPGGEVNSGFGIYDTMRFISSDVVCLTAGLCASIATIINLGAKKEHRLSLPNSRFLIHQPLIGGQVQGQASDLEITAREIIKTRKKINDMLSEECQQPFEKVEEDTTRDYWMNAEESLEYGLISKIITSVTDLKSFL